MKQALLLLTLLFSISLHASDFPAGSPKFFTSAAGALKEAKENGKPVILVFSASWCGPCQSMKKDVYPSSVVQPLQDKFNWAYLDIDDETNGKLAKTYQVESIPSLFFLDADGKTTLDELKDVATPKDFAEKLTSVLKKQASTKKG
ncbi:thioredoxin family protein [Prosthecobacter sp.]|uniref:thioredoxin family protein n=1 Tax=Prosthecobacter sp. TaxID=1965333 RepID=UPI002486E2FD|nr:thioredoxin family protein [Prosthecobacter sp.]MDI1313527.1 thioredoxin family protein [Prosthecobacter sp.]